MRHIQTSVNNFVHHGDEYLFLLRNKDKRVDPGRLNSIGGKVESGENYLDSVMRETEEEIGMHITPEQVQFLGVVRLEGGYEEDWVMCFFKTEIPTKHIKHGTKTSDGELLWIHKDKVLNSGYELVDDLYYSFEDIIRGDELFFANAVLNDKQKVEKYSVTKLQRK